MRLKLRKLFAWCLRRTFPPPPDQQSTINKLNDALIELAKRDDTARASYMERVAELVEARSMAGAGPWQVSPAALTQTDRIISDAQKRFSEPRLALQESSTSITAQGAYGDIELALQNVEWRREVNLSWLEFSRWGIQQIILISRLYYIKNPIIRRLVDVCAAYVFARGVEVSSSDETSNEVLKEFFERNKKTLGQNALCDLERRKDYDGNLFFVLFSDTQDKGLVGCRTIDATEIQEIVSDPEDSDTPRFYRRVWTQRVFNESAGTYENKPGERWYPALGYEPATREKTIGKIEVDWDAPVLHRPCGGIAKWAFGCPRIYPALDWAKEGRKFLEACASVKAALAQIAYTITTKGGQQALEGIKQQIGTQVGPTNSLWDTNPPAGAGSTFASGPGTKLEAMMTRQAGADPEEVRQYKLMCCMVAGVPETFLGDVSTGNLATATSLDRPTETVFLEKQEAWREDLLTIATYVLKVSKGAPSGRLRESGNGVGIKIVECRRKLQPNGDWVYEAFKKKDATEIELRCNFPAIREGDIPALVTATVEAITLGSGGQVTGIDAKAGVRKLYDLLGMENGDELSEEQYPEGTYEPDRTLAPPPDPKAKDPLREALGDAVRQIRKAARVGSN